MTSERAWFGKLSALRTDDYFRDRPSDADLEKADRVLKTVGGGKPPLAGDEVE